MIITLLFALLGGALAGYAIAYDRGFKAGTKTLRDAEVEAFEAGKRSAACEPPTNGRLHFHDGPIRQLADCSTPFQAIEMLTKEQKR